MARSAETVVVRGSEFDVFVNFMDDGSVRVSLPGSWVIKNALSGKGGSRINLVRYDEG
jgi:hypothetical protein